MAATIWNGRITFGLVSIPVKLVTSTRDHDISFHYLHRKDLSRIKMQYICANDEEVVERSELVKGYEYKKNEYIVVEPEELERIQPESSSNLDIQQFIDLAEVDPVYYERSYYVVPGAEGTEKTFSLLATAMKNKNRAAIGKLLMRDHEYLALIRPSNGGLVLETMHYEDEIKENPASTENKKIRDKEMDLAEQIVDNLTEPFDPGKYKDEYTERVQELLDAKIKGEKVRFFKPRPKKTVSNLLTALQKSVEQTQKSKKRPAAR